MNKLIQTIESIRAKLDGLRRHSLKEMPTRTIIIDPMLEALGWDIRDPNEAELEYPTVDGKSVDYALKISGKAVLLVEAKALGDPLSDVKAITQVVGYATNAGVEWCLLTNGETWRVYCALEKCEAPKKMMFEVSLSPQSSPAMTAEKLAERLWPISKTEVAKGTLREIHQAIFVEGRVRCALDALMADPPRSLVNLVRKNIADRSLSATAIRGVIPGIWTGRKPATGPTAAVKESLEIASDLLRGRPQQVVDVFRAVDSLCMAAGTQPVIRRIRKGYFAYSHGKKKTALWGAVKNQWVRLTLSLPYSQVEDPPPFASQSPYKANVVLRIGNLEQLKECRSLILKCFED